MRDLLVVVLAAGACALAAANARAGEACPGKYADMHSYAGKYTHDADFLATPLVAARLGQLPAPVRRHLKRNLDVSGPIDLVTCHLVISGAAPHLGTEEDAILDVNLSSGTVTAAIHARGHIDIYVISDPAAGTSGASWDDLPQVVRHWAVMADMGFPSQQPTRFEQPSTVRLHAPTGPPAEDKETMAPPVKVIADAKATLVQATAIRRAAAKGPADCREPDQSCYSLSLADVNDDGRPDLLVSYVPDPAMGGCGTVGCGGVIVMATADGYADKAIQLPYFNEMEVLPGKHHGMHDLQFDRVSPLWLWNGSEYAIEQGAGFEPGAGTAPWETRNANGRILAMASPINSTIKTIVTFCNQGKPMLAMLRKMPLSAKSVTLTWAFRGWTVNVPLIQGNRAATLWTADLTHSDLPEWLAHRGDTATTRALARAAEYAFLRINGDMEGTISLKNSTAATQAALGSCYRYR